MDNIFMTAKRKDEMPDTYEYKPTEEEIDLEGAIST